MSGISEREDEYLLRAYSDIDLDAPQLNRFHDEIYEIMTNKAGVNSESSILDIGCGRGYMVEYLRNHGIDNVQGIDPSTQLKSTAIAQGIMSGSFEKNSFPDDAFDLVYTCHTLHHLENNWPTYAIQEMKRIARKYVVIVEINNTNLPMFLLSVALKSVEINAFKYNRGRVTRMMEDAGLSLCHQQDLSRGYLSGESFLHRIAAHIGSPPYNILIGDVSDATPG